MTLCGDRYNNLYFNHPVWITGHNLFHAPLLLMAYAAAGRTAWRRGATWAGPWLWLIAGCGLHTAVDFVTHVDDGPLPLFPIGRSRRVRGLVSYWDPEFGGRWFSRLEKLGSILLAVWVFLSWMRRHHNR